MSYMEHIQESGYLPSGTYYSPRVTLLQTDSAKTITFLNENREVIGEIKTSALLNDETLDILAEEIKNWVQHLTKEYYEAVEKGFAGNKKEYLAVRDYT